MDERYPICPKCGHSAGMHVKGASPKFAGCMVMTDESGRRVPTCPCQLRPDEIPARRLREDAP